MIRSRISVARLYTALLTLTVALTTLLDPVSAIAATESGRTSSSNVTTLKAVREDGSVILRISNAELNGISASGLRGISASGLYGISASGLRGISASGLYGISASGLRGISASGLYGISASGLYGISASGLRGISASGLRGISASGLRGISASGLRGISASGLYGISASGLRGISASGLYGISASGLRGISASGLYGISASGLRGISASGLYGISASGLRGISASGQVSNESENAGVAIEFQDLPLGAIGPVSMISKEGNVLTVLGQNIVSDAQTLIITLDEESGVLVTSLGGAGIEKLNLGDYLVIASEIVEPGTQLGTVIIRLRQDFETGTSLAYLRSIFTKESSLSASVMSGNSVVDTSAALFNTDLANTSASDAVEYYGFATASNPNKLIANFGHLANEDFN